MNNELIKFTTNEKGITIHIPNELLIFVAENHPDGAIEIFDKGKFVEQVAFELEENSKYDSDTGLTGFQQLIDDACFEVAVEGNCADFKD